MGLKWSGNPVPASADSMCAQAAMDIMVANVIPGALAATEPADQEEMSNVPEVSAMQRFPTGLLRWFGSGSFGN